MIMDEMTMQQVALAAECISLARGEFLNAAVYRPLAQALEGLGLKLETSAPESEAERLDAARGRARGKKGGRKLRHKTPEERDAAIYRAAAQWGFPIEDAPKPASPVTPMGED